MKDETIMTLAAVAGLTVVACFTCAFNDCVEITSICAVLAGVAGFSYSQYRNAAPKSK